MNITNNINPDSMPQALPLGVCLCYVIIVEWWQTVPIVAVRLQEACNDGDTITLLP